MTPSGANGYLTIYAIVRKLQNTGEGSLRGETPGEGNLYSE